LTEPISLLYTECASEEDELEVSPSLHQYRQEVAGGDEGWFSHFMELFFKTSS
jgi:hypothetical protein